MKVMGKKNNQSKYSTFLFKMEVVCYHLHQHATDLETQLQYLAAVLVAFFFFKRALTLHFESCATEKQYTPVTLERQNQNLTYENNEQCIAKIWEFTISITQQLKYATATGTLWLTSP